MTAENRHKASAAALTLLFHAVLIFLLIYFVLTPPDPPLSGGEGMVVNLGYVDEATGDIQPMSEDVTTDPQPVEPTPSLSQPVTDNVVTQNEEKTADIKVSDAPPSETRSQVTDNRTTEVPKKTEPERTVDARALYKGKNTGSTSQGTSDKGVGDQGSRDGDPNSNNYGNAGTGNTAGPGGTGGPNWKLAGRVPKALPHPEYNVQEEGRVVVEITVDKHGNVVSAKPGVKGSTTTNDYLLKRAQLAALAAKFNPDPNGEEIQIGTIVYDFKLR